MSERTPHAMLVTGGTEEDRKLFITRNSKPRNNIVEITAEQSIIKVDQIRELQLKVNSILTGNQIQVIINSINQCNRAAINALLKILEEPPEGVRFFLSAPTLEQVLPTIRSRCWHYYLPPPLNTPTLNQQYIDDWCTVLNQTKSPCAVAQAWSERPLIDILHDVYLILACALKKEENMQKFRILTNDQWLWKKLDHLQTLLKRMHISLNKVLAIESILL